MLDCPIFLACIYILALEGIRTNLFGCHSSDIAPSPNSVHLCTHVHKTEVSVSGNHSNLGEY